MPDIDGLELFQSIRKLENIKKAKFIVLTGKVFEFDHRLALHAGVDGYMTKPVNKETFVRDISEIINAPWPCASGEFVARCLFRAR